MNDDLVRMSGRMRFLCCFRLKKKFYDYSRFVKAEGEITVKMVKQRKEKKNLVFLNSFQQSSTSPVSDHRLELKHE